MAINFPNNPSNGDTFVVDNLTYTYDSANTKWDLSDQAAVYANLSALQFDVLPATTDIYDLGSASQRWKDLHLAGNTIHIGAGQITADAVSGAVTLPAGSKVGTTPIGSIGYPAITKLDVTYNGNTSYKFENQYGSTDNPTIYAISGTTIAFNLNPLAGAHPFAIQRNTGGGFTNYSETLVYIDPNGTEARETNAQGKNTGILYWQIPAATFTGAHTFRYICTSHPAMTGSIVIKDISSI